MWCFLQNSRTSAPGDFATGRMVHRAASGLPGHHRARAGGPRPSHNRLILGVEPFFPSPHPTRQTGSGVVYTDGKVLPPPHSPDFDLAGARPSARVGQVNECNGLVSTVSVAFSCELV